MLELYLCKKRYAKPALREQRRRPKESARSEHFLLMEGAFFICSWELTLIYINIGSKLVILNSGDFVH